jgi:predicted RNA-binding protein YlxR (DUF448 family)
VRGMAEPVRMCLGCGARARQAELLRLAVVDDNTLTIAARRHSGRTGYLHRNQECWDRFAGRKGLVRSLGRTLGRPVRALFVQQLKRLEQSVG